MLWTDKIVSFAEFHALLIRKIPQLGLSFTIAKITVP